MSQKIEKGDRVIIFGYIVELVDEHNCQVLLPNNLTLSFFNDDCEIDKYPENIRQGKNVWVCKDSTSPIDAILIRHNDQEAAVVYPSSKIEVVRIKDIFDNEREALEDTIKRNKDRLLELGNEGKVYEKLLINQGEKHNENST